MSTLVLPAWPALKNWPNLLTSLVNPAPNAAVGALVVETEALLAAQSAGKNESAVECLRAGLWLLADELDRSHRICQDLPSRAGSAWHAVMHRREGDFSNSCYWWRQAGNLNWLTPERRQQLARAVAAALPESLPQAAAWRSKLLRPDYDPAAFTRLVESEHGRADAQAALAAVQRAEWQAMMEQCWADAQ